MNNSYGDVIYQDTFQTIYWSDNSILTMYWMENTESMNYSQFQGCLHIFSGFCEQKNPEYAMIDSGDFKGVPMLMNFGGDEMKDIYRWRQAHISPNYNRAGIKKFAFTRGTEGEVLGYEENNLPGDKFPTRVFLNPDEAINWLLS